MTCKSYSTPVSVTLYPVSSVSFDRPFSVFAPLVPSGYATIPSPSSGIKLILSDFARAVERTPTTSVGGTKRRVSIEYSVSPTDTDKALAQLQPLMSGSYHVYLTYLNGGCGWVRNTLDTFRISYSESNGELNVSITSDTVSGIQRIAS